MHLLTACGVLVVLAGCFGPSAPFVAPTTIPDGWQASPVLHAFFSGGTHSGASEVALNHSTLARPGLCQAYRGATHLAVDTCVVRDPDKWERADGNYGDAGVGAWVVEADWAGCPGGDFEGCHGTPQPGPGEKRVVAFDFAGRVVAHWNGQWSPDTQFVTE